MGWSGNNLSRCTLTDLGVFSSSRTSCWRPRVVQKETRDGARNELVGLRAQVGG